MLADLLAAWNVPAGSTPLTVRKASIAAQESSLWDVERRAIGYLEQVERDLDAMEAFGEDVTYYRECMPVWWAAVFSFDLGWQQSLNTSVSLMDRGELRLLRALAGQIDTMRLSPRVQPGQLAALRAKLEESLQLVQATQPPTLDDAAKRYMLTLVHEALRVVDEVDLVGAASVRRVVFELGGAMTTVAEQTPDENEKKKWHESARGFLVEIVRQAPAAIAGAAADGTLGAITGG